MNPRTTSVRFMIHSLLMVVAAAVVAALWHQGGWPLRVAAIIPALFGLMQLLNLLAMVLYDLRTVALLRRSRRHQCGDFTKG